MLLRLWLVQLMVTTLTQGEGSLPAANSLEAGGQSAANDLEAAASPDDKIRPLDKAVADLSQRFYHEMSKREQGNFAFSPISLHSVLSLLLLGTDFQTDTSEEIQRMLGSITNPVVLKDAYRQLLTIYKKQNAFKYDNHIWVDERFNLNPKYEEEVYLHLATNTSRLRFADEAASLEAINSWVRNVTEGRVSEAIQQISDQAGIYLGNAIYLKEKWNKAFEDQDSSGNPLKRQPFYLRGEGGQVEVKMMKNDRCNVTLSTFSMPGDEEHQHQIITIPYQNKDFAMQIILPDKRLGGDGLKVLEDQIGDALQRDLSAAVQTSPPVGTVNVFLQPEEGTWEQLLLRMPSFKISTKLDAADVFKRMNLSRVFSADSELEKMTTDGSKLSVEKIAHAALIDVDKEGTVAAGATVVEIVFLSAASTPTEKKIVVDRPFIFIVRDMVHKIPVMVGRVTNPNGDL